ncbi:F0F1 ATP synthase subunit A [Desulfobulbus alkaliphilus]|uniref:F0F1 ATP synthase subunit A n=1 Tax=Desulfobulbus alkaliphilus TaxID=869814 RepID=UPI001962624C|nr:F0F1 ATP synthase subunit A [Desulfobulbus alkaliphilus]MBM9536834.1 F0F1 ATP synthase subunit A [Desulfobulbus alkaliphilus]
MEHPILFISLILELLGLPVPHTPIGHTFLEKLCAPYMTYTWMVMAFLIIVPKLTLGKMEMIPGSGQNFWEVTIGGLMGACTDTLGEKGAKMLFPMLATFFFYIVVSNLIGVIPGFLSPTSSLNITLAMTLIVWVTHHFLGFKYHGLKYYKHFMGPSKVLAPFMFIIELISNFARLISLSMRLFGNIFAKEVLLTVLFMLAGAYFAPLPILALGVLVSVIQGVVFVMLAMIYCAGAMEEAH